MSPTRSPAKAFVVAMRPHQWTKNVLVFAVPIAAGEITEISVLVDSVLAFIAFCLAASATYLLNDAGDVESDRRHPVKCKRPIAAGELSVGAARIGAVILLVGALTISALVDVNLLVTVLAYVLLTTAYTLWLKHEPVVDIVAVAAGFVLRAIAGATATSLPISEWFFIVASFGALLMVTGKREGERIELGDDASAVRATLGAYTGGYLVFLRGVSAAVVLVGYCLWAFASAQASAADSDASVFFEISIVPFTVAILRYALLIDQGKGAEPERLVLQDRVLQLAGVTWAIIYGYGIYLA